jgi:hypothetical protein
LIAPGAYGAHNVLLADRRRRIGRSRRGRTVGGLLRAY